nr:MAG TPA: hypothetical protein [Caudoviricetes sp.]
MYRGTTPTMVLTVEGISEIDIDKLYLSLRQFGNTIEKTLEDVKLVGNVLYCTLTQEETLSLFEGKVELQIRIKSKSNVAYATNKIQVDVQDILKEGVI